MWEKRRDCTRPLTFVAHAFALHHVVARIRQFTLKRTSAIIHSAICVSHSLRQFFFWPFRLLISDSWWWWLGGLAVCVRLRQWRQANRSIQRCRVKQRSRRRPVSTSASRAKRPRRRQCRLKQTTRTAVPLLATPIPTWVPGMCVFVCVCVVWLFDELF